MHSTKPVPGCDVGEVAGGQVAVRLVAKLLSEAESWSVRCLAGWNICRCWDCFKSLYLLPDFDFDTAAYSLQERESGRFGRRLGIVELKGCESGAFVDGIAEDKRLSSPWSAVYISFRQKIITAHWANTYHFSHQPTLKPSSVVRKQRNVVNSRTEPRHSSSTTPDNTVQSVVRSLLHASELFLGIQAIAAELLGKDCESGCIR